MVSNAYDLLQSSSKTRIPTGASRPFTLRDDKTPKLAPICEDFINGNGDDYVYGIDLVLEGNVITSCSAPRPGTGSARRRNRIIQNARDAQRRRRYKVVGYKWVNNPEAQADCGGYCLNFRVGTKWFHCMTPDWSKKKAISGPNELLLSFDVEADEERCIEASRIEVYRAEVENILTESCCPIDVDKILRQPKALKEFRLKYCGYSVVPPGHEADFEKAWREAAVTFESIIKTHATARRYFRQEITELADVYTGRTNRPICGRSAKVERDIRLILGAVDVNSHKRSLHVTITPPDDCAPATGIAAATLQERQMDFLRVIEKAVRKFENDNEPFENIRIMEIGGPPVPSTFGKPYDKLRPHDHYLLIAHREIVEQDRRIWARDLEDAMIAAAETYLGKPLLRKADGTTVAIDVRVVASRNHMKVLVLKSKKKKGRPYLCGEVPTDIKAVRRRWFSHRNLPPDLSEAPDVVVENKVFVSGRRASALLDFDTYARLRTRLYGVVHAKIPEYSVHFALVVPSYLVLDILENLGVDVTAVPIAHRVDHHINALYYDRPPPGAGVLKTWPMQSNRP